MSYPQQRFHGTQFCPGSFWAKKRTKISTTAILQQLDAMKKTGRYDAFSLKWSPVYDEEKYDWPVAKHCFWDSDVAKWIEGACYFLTQEENVTVRKAVDELVDMIAAAQQSDGYLNVHFTVVDPDGRFQNLRDQHELYNAGHLIEAALAHEQLCGNRKLLDPIIRYVDLLVEVFGPDEGQKPGYPGHPETELALLRLYDRTRDPKHLALGQFFITERGNPKGIDGMHYFDYEAEQRDEGLHEVADAVPTHRSYWYQQAHVPLLQQQSIEGHSVRAAYLLTGLADLVRIQGKHLDGAYSDALHRLWNNMVQKKMYVTGGIGAVKQWEGFGIDYFLPQGTDEGGCYAETCASIGVMMLTSRLIEIERNGFYGDILELELYNAVLTGVAIDGKSWTYVNQLASSEADPSRRSEWFEVSCCPPNMLRLLGALGGYFYSCKAVDRQVALTIVLYADMDIVEKVGLDEIRVSMRTKWPLDGKVIFMVNCPGSIELTIFYRIPGWASSVYTIEPTTAKAPATKGFGCLDSQFIRNNRSFAVNFPMQVRMVSPHPSTGQRTVAVQRGPLIYCVEDADNTWVKNHFKSTFVSAKPQNVQERLVVDETTGEEYVAVGIQYHQPTQLETLDTEDAGPSYASGEIMSDKHLSGPKVLNFIPYYFRANRGGRGQMRVGLNNLDSFAGE